MRIVFYPVTCRACGKLFLGRTRKKALMAHKEHIRICEVIKIIEKIGHFGLEAEKILGRKISFNEAAELLGCKFKKQGSKNPAEAQTRKRR